MYNVSKSGDDAHAVRGVRDRPCVDLFHYCFPPKNGTTGWKGRKAQGLSPCVIHTILLEKSKVKTQIHRQKSEERLLMMIR